MSGVVVKIDANPIRPPQQLEEGSLIFCPCDFRCPFIEKVFADPSNDGIKNDFTDFLFQKITSSDTVNIQLLKGSLVVATISDDTYGTYYNGFDSKPLYVGWQADWTAIFNAFSGGRYQVRTTTNILGVETVYESRLFQLNTYDDLSANRTVKIESFQDGQIANSEFDFTGLVSGGWRSSIRLEGEFGEMQPNLERDIYEDSNYRQVQNRDLVNREFTLRANFVPESIQNRIATKDILGNTLLITSYDVLQEKKYRKFAVAPESFSDVRYDKLGRTFFEIVFSDRQKNIIKTNI